MPVPACEQRRLVCQDQEIEHQHVIARAAELRCELNNALGRKSYDCETTLQIRVSGGREDRDWTVERRERFKRSELNGSILGQSNDKPTETTELVQEIACP